MKNNCFIPFNSKMPSVYTQKIRYYFKFQIEEAQSPAFFKSLTTKHIIKTHYECSTLHRTTALDASNSLMGACQVAAHLLSFLILRYT